MGFGTNWRMGHASEARLWWEERLPKGRAEIFLKFVTDLELQFLRAVITNPTLTIEETIRDVKVAETAFPQFSDPEWQSWYENMETSPPRVNRVLDEFLDEFCAIKNQEEIAKEWTARWDPNSLKTLDHAKYCLKEIVALAKVARQEKMGILARTVGL